ncbi:MULTISPECIES: glutamate synthase subunit beta [unclassified Campylobacter]|uniref:glutamate synthase subunit beta n=1 Tax=unclassified Campylobacter TaxID=2593542 RepID=UPI00123824EE|nr:MULTISPECIES: glutamate synthase subunit beta [unclassified Campylobacter]KAA6227215.1 glutamate synthase subunit beta [Campylobacter sp. LR286c]KAA6227911.1 glutamate synthase subunit beta [Campylobacter sp. LR185c]KAA6228320.1 glutamate synthase subunit beta [Campylobacter sp. LR196d]KAA6229321.1 glutamate synthase subunit beta [Campylobacter sp. LR291e]KAA6231127.1 glutamate synthase subunit beta [Campylobacter sp. LR264d]
MGNIRGFLDFKRVNFKKLDSKQRIKNFKEFSQALSKEEQEIQGGRCMNCGVAFCQAGLIEENKEIGCPLRNLIPEWNDLIYKGLWEQAYERLDLTNPFPEFTGRVCPAPCEDSCVCAINGASVSIKNNEFAIIENAFKEKFIKISKPNLNGKKMAIVGSGPAGLACGYRLNELGFKVSIFERSDRIGGLLMYGIPDMKLEKSVINRRVELLKKSGIEFHCSYDINSKEKANKLLKDYDGVVLCTGASKAIDLNIKGRNLKNIMFAVDFLTMNTKSLLDKNAPNDLAKNKDVLIIGSGDTSVDCVAVALRQGAKSITRFERSPKRPLKRVQNNPWPLKADIFSTDYGLEEAIAVYGKDVRMYQKLTKEFVGENGFVKGVYASDLKREAINSKMVNVEIANSSKFYKADLILLAMGFSGSENELKSNFNIKFDEKNNILTNDYQTSHKKIFACGDARMGQALVVWAIKDGLECANSIYKSFFA